MKIHASITSTPGRPQTSASLEPSSAAEKLRPLNNFQGQTARPANPSPLANAAARGKS